MFQHFSSDGVMEYVDMQMYGHQETGSFVVFDLFFSWSANDRTAPLIVICKEDHKSDIKGLAFR